jgi:hypothetical protein
LASYNHLPNPNLILTGQVLSIPPAGYRPVAPLVVTVAASPIRSAQILSAPARNSAPVSAYKAVSPPTTGGSGVWGCIAQHESGGNASINTGNGFYGAFQFTVGSWRAAGGGPGLPSSYSYSQQEAIAINLQRMSGWGNWPVTSGECGV